MAPRSTAGVPPSDRWSETKALACAVVHCADGVTAAPMLTQSPKTPSTAATATTSERARRSRPSNRRHTSTIPIMAANAKNGRKSAR